MSLHRNKTVRPLSEELADIGLDPEKTLGEIHRTTALIDKRMNGNTGGGAPSYVNPGQRILHEVNEYQQHSLMSHDDGDGEGVEEAMQVMRKQRKSAAEKLKAKRSRKKRKSKLRKAAKMYYKKAKRKILQRAKKKLKKFGKAGLEKLHKMGRRIVMSDDRISNLREDLNIGSASENSNPYEEAAFSAGMLTMYLGEIFEAAGDLESAETMYDVSDAAADMSESWSVLGEEDELDEDQSEKLERVLDHTVKALKVYEAMGAPSLMDVIEAMDEDEDSQAA